MLAKVIENPRLISLFTALLIVAGLAAVTALPTSEDPRVMNRIATVLTPYPGATPERVEALVTEPLENALRSLPEVETLSSNSQAGISVIRVILKDSIKQTAPVWSEARDQLGEAQSLLPDGALTSRLDDNRGYAYTRLIALSWDSEDDADVAIVARYSDELATRLRSIEGTDLVRRYGDPDEEIHVDIDPVQAARAGLGITEVAAAIESRDAKVSAGQLRGGEREWLLEVSGELDNLENLAETIVREGADGHALRLRDVAEVRRGLREPLDNLTLVDGQRSVVVAVRMLSGFRINDWSQRIDRVVDEFSSQIPSNIQMTTLFDQQVYTNQRLGGLLSNVLIGFVVILIVLFMTLGWRAALVVAFALPLTVAFTLACMRAYGLPIHQMSVTGLVVALGIMVDNAIVMTDTVQRLMREGQDRITAVKRSIRHLWAPLAGSTLTTILAFLPIAIMPGPSGEFVGGIAISVIFALLGSYLISHTLVAGLAGRFLQPEDRHSGIELPQVSANFRRFLLWVLGRPRTAFGLALILPLAGFFAATQMEEQFFPPSDRDMFTVEIHLEPAAGLAATEASVAILNPLISAHPGVESVIWNLGGSAPSIYYNMLQRYDQTPNFAHAIVKTSGFKAANEAIPALQKELDEILPGAQIMVRKLEQGPPFNAPIELRIYGPSLDRLAEFGDRIRAEILQTEDVIHARATLTKGRPKVRIEVDENQVRRAGLAPVTLARQLQSILDGVDGGSIIETTEELPVRLRLAQGDRLSPDDLLSLYVSGNAPGPAIALSSLGNMSFEPSAGIIARRQGQRINTIETYLRAGVLPAVVQKRIEQNLAAADLRLPPGYHLEFGGESAERDSAVGNLLGNVGLILVLLITVVVLSFNSFRLSAIVFTVASLSAGLGLLCVWLTGYPFGFVVIIGLMGLIGLAINAAIVILAELKTDPAAARGEPQAMAEGIMKCTRHISSTTMTTLGGFMPLILSGGGFWPPFAIAIAGGTVLASILSFMLVPAAFRWFALRKPFDVTGQYESNPPSNSSEMPVNMPSLT